MSTWNLTTFVVRLLSIALPPENGPLMTHQSPPLQTPDSDRTGGGMTGQGIVENRSKKPRTLGGLVLVGLMALYATAQPALNQRFGWQLPGLPQAAERVDPPANERNADRGNGLAVDRAGGPDQQLAEEVPVAATVTVERAADSKSPLADSPERTSAERTDSSQSLLYGLLSDQGGKRYLSPAGLLYVPGSQEGHRLRHVERHVADDPGRPGSHGVFDGGMPGALATIDKAYLKAQTGAQTTMKEEDGRTIYTVDLGSRVGFIGGSEGRRRRNPMARRVRLVLDKNRVITAYPM
jgi:hypothetical protein